VETGREVAVTVLWNQQVQTDRTILNNKLIIFHKKENKKLTYHAHLENRNAIRE